MPAAFKRGGAFAVQTREYCLHGVRKKVRRGDGAAQQVDELDFHRRRRWCGSGNFRNGLVTAQKRAVQRARDFFILQIN
jgi:hypothetical protein